LDRGRRPITGEETISRTFLRKDKVGKEIGRPLPTSAKTDYE